MNEIERIEIIVVKLNDRLTIQENKFVHLKNKGENNEIKEKVIIYKMIIVIIM